MSNTQKLQLAEEKRSRRLLMCLLGKRAQLVQSSKESTFLLVIAGERTIKCQRKIIANWLSAGYVKIATATGSEQEQYVAITDAGWAYLKRSQSGDFSDQHRDVEPQTVTVAGTRQTAMRNINESPLSPLFHRKTKKGPWLNLDQFNAGERLRSDFEFSQLTPNVTSSWDPTAGLGKKSKGSRLDDSLTDRVFGARERLNRALTAVGPEFSGVLLDVCCFLKGMEQVECERQWPRRSAKLLLKAALSALARHYGSKEYPVKSATIRHWSTADNRPKM